MILLALLACGTPTAVQSGDGENSDNASYSDLEIRVTALEQAAGTVDALALRVGALENSVAAQVLELDDFQERLAALENGDTEEGLTGRVASLETEAAAMQNSVDALTDDVEHLLGAQAALWSMTASGTTGGRTSSWTSIATDELDLTLTDTGTLFAWCYVTSSGSSGSARIAFTDPSGTGTTSATIAPEVGVNIIAATFNVAAAGDATISCEGQSGNWSAVTIQVLRAAAGG